MPAQSCHLEKHCVHDKGLTEASPHQVVAHSLEKACASVFSIHEQIAREKWGALPSYEIRHHLSNLEYP